MKNVNIHIFIIACILSLTGLSGVTAQTASTNVYYSGFQACGGCTVCGADYWCINTDPSWCGPTPACDSKIFTDPVPAGNIVTNITINYWTANCNGNYITGYINGNVYPTVNELSTGCLCSSLPCGMSATTGTTFPCGVSGYNYGGANTLQICTGNGVCMQRVELIMTYAPADQSTPPAAPGGITGPASVCVGSNGTYFISAVTGAATYTWSVPGGWTITSGQGTTSINVTAGAGAGNICVIPTNLCGTSGPSCLAVSGAAVPVAPTSATVAPNNFCADDPGNISLTAVGGSGTTCTWYTGGCGGAVVGTGNPLSIPSPTATTVYYCSWSTSCGTSACANVTVTVLPLPTDPTSAISSNNNFCADDPGNISLSVAGGSGTSVNWYTGSCGGAFIGSGNPLSIASPTTTTTYYAAWTNSCGTSGCASTTVTVFPLPVAPTLASVNNNNFCQGTVPNITLTATGGSGNTLNWSTSCGGAVIGTGTPLTIASPATTTTYYAWWTNGCGNSTCASTTVNVYALPTANAGIDVSIPTGTSTTLDGTGGGGSGSYNYNWSPPGDLVNPNIEDPTTVNLFSTTTFTITVTDGNGCTASDQVTVTVSGPILSVTTTATPNSICAGQSSQLNANASGGSGSYTYSWASNPVDPSLAGQTTLQNPVVTPVTTTIYTVTVSDGFSTASSSVTVSLFPNPVIFEIQGGGPYCTGGSGVPVGLNGSEIGVTYQLYVNGNPVGAPVAGTGGPISFGNQTAAGTYTIIATNTTTLCQSNMNGSVTITINPLPTAYNVTGGGSFCAGDPGVVVGLDGSDIGINYQLYVDGNPIGVPVAGTGSAISFGNQTTAGNYTVIATDATTSCQNTMTGSVNIAVFANPVADAGLDVSIPNGTSTTLNGSASGGSGSYLYNWSPAGDLVDPSLQNPTTVNLSVTTTFTITVTDQVTGCTGTDQVTVTITGAPLSVTTSAVPDIICVGDSSQLTALASGGSGTYTYSWISSPAGFTSNISNPVVSPVVTTTYTVTVNDGFSTVTSSVVVTVNPLPAVYNVTGSGSYCSGDAGIPICLSGSDVGVDYQLQIGGVDTGTPIAGTGAPICFSNQTAAGTYTVVATNAATGCQIPMNGNAIITVDPNPIADAGPDAPVYNGCSTTLSGSASGGSGSYLYNWSPAGDLVDPSLQNPTTVNLSVTTTFTVTVTDQVTGCTGTDQVTIIITGPPLSANATAAPSSICSGTSTFLLANAVGGSTVYTYSWSSNPSGFSSTLPNPAVSPVVNTVYTVTVTDGCGNTAISSVTVTVNANPAADAGPDALICNGASTTLNASGGVTYSWNPGIGLSATNINNPVASPTTNMTYVVTVTDINGCTASDGMNVTIFNVIPADAGIDQAICTGEQAFLNASGGISFSWTPAATLSSSIISNPIATPASTTTYTVVTTDANGCTSMDMVVVTVNTGVLPFAGNDVVICSGNTAALSASGGTFYNWSPSTGLSDTTIANPVASPQYTTTYIVTVSNGNGCSGTDDVSVTVNSSPSVNAGSDVAICYGEFTVLNATGGLMYTWSPNVALSSTTVANPTANPTATITYVVTGTGPNGCAASDDVIVTVNLAPNPDAGQAVTICNHESATLVATGGSGYLWNNGIANDTNIVSPSVNTVYSVTVTGTGGCTATDNVSVSVLSFEPPVITASGTTTFCNTPINVMLTSSTGFSSYLWSDGSTSQSINVTTAGTYYCQGTTSNGCSDTSNSIVVASYPALTPPVIVANGPSEFCEKDTISVDLYTNTSYYYYQWSSGSNTPAIHVTHAGQYWVTVTDANGCSAVSIAPYTITYIPYPVAYMNYFASGTYVEFYNYSLNDVSYLWDFGDGTTSTLENPIHTYTAPGTYQVIFQVTNICGTSEVSMWITIVSGVGVDEMSSVQNLQVYPIPTKDLLYVSFETNESNEIEFSIINILGQEVYNEALGSVSGKYHKVLNLLNYPSGVYCLQIKSDKGITNHKIIVN